MNYIRIVCYFLLTILIFFIYSCSDDNELSYLENEKINPKELMDGYIKNANDKSRTKEQRSEDAGLAWHWSSKLIENRLKRDKQSQIALIYRNINEYDKYGELNKKVLILSKRIKDSLGIAKSYSHLGTYFNHKKDRDSAFYSFYNSDKIYKQFSEKDPQAHGITLYNMAIIQRRYKDYVGSEANTVEAIDQLNDSFKIINDSSKEDRTYLTLFLCYNNLGIISKDLGRNSEAIKNYQNSLEYIKKFENGKLREIKALNNIGVVYKNQKDYQKAVQYYEEALSYKDVLKGYAKTKALLIDNLAYVRFLAGEEQGVLESLYESLTIRDSINDKSGLVTNHLHLAEYYNQIAEDSLAIEYATKAKNQAQLLNSNKELLDALLFLSDVTPEEEAVQYAKSYIKINDSLLNVERISRDKFARIQFRTDEITEEKEKISRFNQILIFAVLGITALFSLIYIIIKQQQNNKELQFSRSQQATNEEIYRLMLLQQAKLQEGREIEKHRMSEELHDGVLGRLFGVRLSLDGLNQRANDGFTETRNIYIKELKDIEKEIRLISHDLGTNTLSADIAYVDVVEKLVSDQCSAHKVGFEFRSDINIEWETVNDVKKVNLYRIIQESMQNIFKHAKADFIKINFTLVEDKINLTILDNGIGFKTAKVKKGIGIKNITSRVGQMQGIVDFVSNATGGTKVAVSIPI